ncbi:MAG: DUF4349 domain-containing protein [Candidatus Hydrogenedentes bacterium]|nr:DUF4349 domain-containing protein [Candidatus Hydrogenedentota bacterium]
MGFNDSLKHVARAEPAASASVLPVPALPAAAAASILQGATPVQPHLVKTVDIHLQADDVRAQSAALQSLTTEMGGYLSALDEDSNSVERTVIRLTLRIPAQQLDEAMKRIEALGKVFQRSMTTQDVTLQFVDMQSRLRNLEKTEARLLAHLEQSGPMEAILTVEKEIDRVRGEVETLQGRINDLGNQIGYATVRVTLSATPTAGPITPAAAFSTSATFTDALRNLVGFAQGVWFIAIWVLVWIPVWVPLAFLTRYIYRRSLEANSSAS